MREPITLTLLPRVWRSQIPMIARGSRIGLARLGRNYSIGRRNLVARDLTAAAPDILAREFGPRDDLLLVRLAERVTAGDARRLLGQFDPLATQLVPALVLGLGPAAGQWAGAVSVGGEIEALEAFTLVGPGMATISLDAGKRVPAPAIEPVPAIEEGQRFSRTRGALGEAVWRQVRASRVAIAGAGRNGSACAMTLAMLGVCELILIDDDNDELHGLDATVGARREWVGRPKVINRRAALLAARPDDLGVETLPTSLLDEAVVEHLREVDLLVTCVDRDAGRLAAAMLANRLGLVHLDFGTGIFTLAGEARRMGADVRLLLPGEACVVCLGGLRNLEQARQELAAPLGALRRGPRIAWHQQRAGSLVTINQVAVNLGVQLWLDLLAGQVTESRWLRLEWGAGGELRVESSSRPTGGCDVCRG